MLINIDNGGTRIDFCAVDGERLLPIIEEFGKNYLLVTVRKTLEGTEAQVRRRRVEPPDGTQGSIHGSTVHCASMCAADGRWPHDAWPEPVQRFPDALVS